ncbi:ankyrin [Aspergillus sclerotiicarbonarius CBS 121057]|uniref:Ankyrin n=1 Tax=Aspergillus sclerotiicarbonarius (strain CBS 121057 / IBT 28362) TaxID=1448318 RepID=A0A319ENC4_ASPSB|nr:ankyrin [Aspergillus sclerotiicarbonarius CBS 121057]
MEDGAEGLRVLGYFLREIHPDRHLLPTYGLMEPPAPPDPLFREHTTGIGDWPLELCLHIEQCLHRPLSTLVDLGQDMAFFRLLKVEAMKEQDPKAIEDLETEPAFYKHEYSKGIAQRCMFEPLKVENIPPIVKYGITKELEYMLQTSLEPTFVSDTGVPLLSLAVVHLQLDCVKLLLKYKADPNQIGFWRKAYPLDYVLPHHLQDSYATQCAIIEVVIQAGGRFTFASAIDIICLENRLDLLQQAVRNETDIRGLRFAHDATVLHRAALKISGGPEIIDYIIEQAPELLNMTDTLGHTALHYALQNTNRDVVKYLLRFPIDLSVVDSFHESALSVAIWSNRVGAVDGMMGRHDLDMLQLHQDIPFDKTPLGRAITTRNEGLLDLLLNYPRMRVPESTRDLALALTRTTFGLHKCWIPMIENLPIG